MREYEHHPKWFWIRGGTTRECLCPRCSIPRLGQYLSYPMPAATPVPPVYPAWDPSIWLAPVTSDSTIAGGHTTYARTNT